MRGICLTVCVAAMLAVGDIGTTGGLLAHGASEGNPAAAWLLAHGGLLTFAACKTALVAVFAGEMRVITHPGLRRAFAVAVCVVLALPVVWNLHDLLLLR